MNAYTCMQKCICTILYTYIGALIHAWIDTSMHVGIHIAWIYIYILMQPHACTYIPSPTYIHTCECVYACCHSFIV